jgi:hypothetical protein
MSRLMKTCLLWCVLFSLSLPLYALKEKTLHVEGQLSRGSWSQLTSNPELNLKKLFDLLGRSPTGERLIKEASYKASRMGMTLTDVVKVGDSSLTDTTLVRKFSPHSPEHVVYESRSVVTIARHLSWDDAILDLAHELTHFIYRGHFNPYSEQFNAKDFIKSTIEGEGGEVQAFLTECQVLRELFSNRVQSRSHCQKIQTSQGEFSFTKAVELFYHLGPYYGGLMEELKKRQIHSSFKDLKDEKIKFISSAYGTPYPVAALMEYELVLNKVCENDKKRLAYMQQAPQRSPAAEDGHWQKFQQSYLGRCSQK